MKRIAAMFIGALVLLTLASAPAFAADGYPGPTTTEAAQPTTQVTDQGTAVEGTTYTFEDCGFQPGSTATVTYNGQPAGTSTADANGCHHITVNVLGGSNVLGVSEGRTQGPSCVSGVEVNGTTFAPEAGTNSVVVTGTGSNGASRTYTNNFTLACSAAQEPVVANVGGLGAGRGGNLPRTGFEVLQWVVIGALLIGVGFVIVKAERRRLARRVAP